jgi:hypothetical protein
LLHSLQEKTALEVAEKTIDSGIIAVGWGLSIYGIVAGFATFSLEMGISTVGLLGLLK